MLSFRESPAPEAQFPRKLLVGNWVNRGNALGSPLYPLLTLMCVGTQVI